MLMQCQQLLAGHDAPATASLPGGHPGRHVGVERGVRLPWRCQQVGLLK